MTSELFSPLLLRSGQVLKNRIAKATMEENMAAQGQLPGEQLYTLYRRWATGGTGLLITGNVMVHAEALTGLASDVAPHDDRGVAVSERDPGTGHRSSSASASYVASVSASSAPNQAG